MRHYPGTGIVNVRDNKMDKIPMTVNGENQLRQDIDKVKLQERKKIVHAISEARAEDYLTENA